jgi:hypothetical protein
MNIQMLPEVYLLAVCRRQCRTFSPLEIFVDDFCYSLRSRQVGTIHPLYLYSAMSDMGLRTLSCGRRASALTSQESWTDCDGG